ncbi:ureidoglycolate lyase [Chelativorans sp.]|uniref:ureidoglycolate lyase n=1 Tax=Chelativorans sp. TaxID=2203393 RepID=UPI00281202B2|nr:ureidoglycolate lyase [Chelativorans sp.]
MKITAVPLTRAAFAPFGDVIDTEGAQSFPINNGKTQRFHDLATVDVQGEAARVLISIARGQPYTFPLKLTMVERHPLGSQAFIPLEPRPFLVVVCLDEGGRPGRPQAFLTGAGQGVNYARNTWHAVLTPIGEKQDFLIVDRGGDGNNLEEFFFSEPYEIHLPDRP